MHTGTIVVFGFTFQFEYQSIVNRNGCFMLTQRKVNDIYAWHLANSTICILLVCHTCESLHSIRSHILFRLSAMKCFFLISHSRFTTPSQYRLLTFVLLYNQFCLLAICAIISSYADDDDSETLWSGEHR